MDKNPRTLEDTQEATEGQPLDEELGKTRIYTEDLVKAYRDALTTLGYQLSKKNAHYLFSQYKQQEKITEPTLLAKVTVESLKNRGIEASKATTEIRKLRKHRPLISG